MASPAKRPESRPGKAEFSIDEFIGEIEKAEAETANKRLPQERLRNKRALDNAARRSAEAESRGFGGDLAGGGEHPSPALPIKGRVKKDGASGTAGTSPLVGEDGRGEAADSIIPGKAQLSHRGASKTKRSEATGMSLKAPKSKANSVERPTNLDGFGETPQAGFGHVASGHSNLPADPRHGQGRQPAVIGTEVGNVGISATVKALEDIIMHGRKEVEGNAAWKPHRPQRPGKSEGGIPFKLVTSYQPAGDQPTAIADLIEGISNGETDQVLLGVTGSGKTYTAAQVIAQTNRPALILAPNKTLAAQLYGEMKSFFPENAVEYFVSYYDYFTSRRRRMCARTDTYIEKESTINEQIDRMRHSATRWALLGDLPTT